MAELRMPCILLTLTLLAAALPAADSRTALEERITIELADAQAKDVFGSFAAILDGRVELDPAVSGRLTIQLREVSVGTVLTALCEMLACEWSLKPGTDEEGPTLRVRPLAAREEAPTEAGTLATPVTLSLDGAPQQQVFNSFATILGAELDLDWEQRVTIELRETPLSQALDEVCAQLGCSWQLDEGGESRELRVWKKPAAD